MNTNKATSTIIPLAMKCITNAFMEHVPGEDNSWRTQHNINLVFARANDMLEEALKYAKEEKLAELYNKK